MKTKHGTLYSEHTEHVRGNYITGNSGDGSITTKKKFQEWDSGEPSTLTIKPYIINPKVIGVCYRSMAGQDLAQ